MGGAPSTSAGAGGPNTPSSNPGYFQDKRGEINDLKVLLRDVSVARDPKKTRDVVRKVIAFDTLGYDCSRLFGEMVLVSGATQDIVVKKMTFHYLSHYATRNPELATLCINTMTKDCRDADPLIRGLAVRSLSSLRLSSTIEYLIPTIENALDDKSAYVRRNGVVAVLKLHHLDPTLSEALVARVRALINDRDAQVVSAALQVLDEIPPHVVPDAALAKYLLKRVPEFPEWGLVLCLQIFARHAPASKEEMFEVSCRRREGGRERGIPD